MRIGTRITLVTAISAPLLLGSYGLVTMRTGSAERELALRASARELAVSLRALVAERPWTEAEELVQRLTPARGAWRVELLAAKDAPLLSAPPSGDARRERLRQLLLRRTAVFDDEAERDGQPVFVHLEPLRVAAPSSLDGFELVGALELTHDRRFLAAQARAEATRLAGALALVIAALVLVVTLTARQALGAPIAKLLRGVDDVARGDLSHVVLAERDDEIGALATRFNDMTASLREAREESRRSADARSALEAHLRDSEKLATVGQLAAEIAHEIGTPLNVVTGRARALEKKADDVEAVRKNAGIIAEQAGRITRIIQRLLDTTRRRTGDSERAEFDLNTLAVSTLEVLDSQLEAGKVVVSPSLRAAPGLVHGDRDQLQQVLINLVLNAVQAMPGGGELVLGTSRVVRRRAGLAVAPEQEWAVVEVADTGVGIAKEHRERIFEPFYTSRAASGGTGLGLAVVQGIVKEHDGWIEVDDHVAAGRGTVFRVHLPLGPTG